MKPRMVYPVEGRSLPDVPHVPHDCDEERCVASGAFTTKKPQAPETPGPSDSADKE